MKRIIARLKSLVTGGRDPMDLLDGTYHRILPKRLRISRGMLKSDRLAYAAGDLVATLCHDDNDNEFSFAQKLRKLPKHWGTLEPLMYYDCLVNNGGHEQYLANSDGAFLDLVEDGLRMCATKYHQDIFKRAMFRYCPERFPEHEDSESFAAPDSKSPYNDLDLLYYAADPKLPELVERFIRSNLSLYRG